MAGSTTASGLTRDPKHRYRWNDGPLVPGITTVIGQKDKSGPLIAWARREAAAKAVRNLEELTRIAAEQGEDAAIDYVKSAPEALRDQAATVGTNVHRAIELMSLGEDWECTEEEQPYVDAYVRDFLIAFRPRFMLVEFMVYSEQHEYGGTGDAICEINGETWMIDYKTSKGIYETTAMQLAALERADWWGRAGDPRKGAIPRIDRYGVVHVRPDKARLVEYHVNQADFDAFLSCRALLRWENMAKGRIIGADIEPHHTEQDK